MVFSFWFNIVYKSILFTIAIVERYKWNRKTHKKAITDNKAFQFMMFPHSLLPFTCVLHNKKYWIISKTSHIKFYLHFYETNKDSHVICATWDDDDEEWRVCEWNAKIHKCNLSYSTFSDVFIGAAFFDVRLTILAS